MAAPKFALSLAFALTLSGAQAKDLPRVGPNASAASLIAARGAVQEPALEFVYKIEGADPRTITVDLAQDFSVVQWGSMLSITDYALRRVITLDDPSHSFQNTSLYSAVESRHAEAFNRRMQRQMLGQAKPADQGAMLAPFWIQSQLHVTAAEDGTPKTDRRADAGGTVHFLYEGEEVASYTPSTHALTKEECAQLAKFLYFDAAIHPVIINDIVASARLPQRLSFKTVVLNKFSKAVWTLQSAVPVKAAFPLLAGSKVVPPKFDGAAAVIAGLIPSMQAAMAGQAPGRRSVEDYRAAIEAALAAKKPFQAVVLGLELSEQYGKQAAGCAKPQGCPSLKDIVAAANGDPRTQILFKALGDGSPQKSDAIKALEAMKRNDLSNPYVLDEFLADDLAQTDRIDDALPLFANAIRGNPYLAGYYKDVGDLFRFQFQPDRAWFCYDVGRALPGGPRAPVIADINDYESELAKNYPQFF